MDASCCFVGTDDAEFTKPSKKAPTDLHATFSDSTTKGILNFRPACAWLHASQMDRNDISIGGAVRRRETKFFRAFDRSIMQRRICERDA